MVAVRGIDLKNLCKTNKPACKALTNIEKTGSGVFYTYDSSGKTTGWTFADHKVSGITPQ
jgi:YD repeat-containing protein